MAFRHQAVHVPDWRAHCRVLDRNERARIIFLAEALERRTKLPGRRNGLLGYVGLAVLRCLAFGFLSMRTGRLDPGYDAIQGKTGLCRQSVANGIARLERCGILMICRRRFGMYQTTSLYRLHPPGHWVDDLNLPRGKAAPFPPRRQLELLELGERFWKERLSLQQKKTPNLKLSNLLESLRGRMEPPTPPRQNRTT